MPTTDAHKHGGGAPVTDLVQTAVRRHADWMAQPDDRLLEHLELRGPRRRFELREEFVDRGLRYPDRYLEFRLNQLQQHGLVTRRDDGTYEITAAGQGYLVGEELPPAADAESVES